MKKTLSLLMLAVIVLSLAACDFQLPWKKNKTEAPKALKQMEKNEEYALKYSDFTYTTNIVTGPAEEGDVTVSNSYYAGNTSKDYQHAFNQDGTLKSLTKAESYTMNDYITDMSTLNWNPLTWETSDDSAFLDMISYSLYGFELNANKNGYSIVPEMAKGMPVDVTKQYAQQAFAEGKDDYLGISYEWVKTTKEAYDNETNPEYKEAYLGVAGFEALNGKTLQQFATEYKCTVEDFIKNTLKFESQEDMDANYARYYVVEFETNKAFRIYLNPDCCWEDGTPIKAADYLYSMKTLLDPKLKNRRADSFYAGSVVLYNAKNYFYAGQSGVGQAELAGKTFAEFNHDDLTFVWSDTEETSESYFTEWLFGKYGSYISSGQFANAAELIIGGFTGGNAIEPYKTLYAEMNGKTLTEIEANENYKAAWDALIGWWKSEDDEELNFFKAPYVFAEVDFNDVGFKTGEDENGEYIEIFVTQPVEKPSYNIPYNFSSFPLVKKSLYETLAWSTTVESVTTYSNAYGTNGKSDGTTKGDGAVKNTASYGPYVLSYYEDGKKYTFTRNENWWGYHDGKHTGQYQMDNYVVEVVADHKTALTKFLAGEIDSIGLQSEDMETYGTSSQLRYNPQSYTTKLSFNTDYETLLKHNTNAQLLCNEKFRNAFGLAIDKVKFATSYTSAGQAGFGILNRLYVYDPVQGAVYRDTDAAMNAIVSFYGVEYGTGKDYKTLKEAYDAVTGYDLTEAKKLMAEAYDECVASGLWNDDCYEAKFDIRVYTDDDIYVNMFNFLNEALKAACVGTGFEGKVSLTMTADADYYETMYAGNCDIIFTTWGGAAARPFEVFYECYCDAAQNEDCSQMEYGFKSEEVNISMVIDGVTYKASMNTWALWADGDADTTISSGENTLKAFAKYDYKTRCAIFANIENAYLGCDVTVPLYYRNSALLMSTKGDYAVQSYVDTVGFGGIQFYTFNYTDAEWANQTSSLDYTK